MHIKLRCRCGNINRFEVEAQEHISTCAACSGKLIVPSLQSAQSVAGTKASTTPPVPDVRDEVAGLKRFVSPIGALPFTLGVLAICIVVIIFATVLAGEDNNEVSSSDQRSDEINHPTGSAQAESSIQPPAIDWASLARQPVVAPAQSQQPTVTPQQQFDPNAFMDGIMQLTQQNQSYGGNSNALGSACGWCSRSFSGSGHLGYCSQRCYNEVGNAGRFPPGSTGETFWVPGR